MKDLDTAYPVPEAWRPIIRKIVHGLVEADLDTIRELEPAVIISETTFANVREYVADYGELLAELPNDTWDTSVSQWMGTHWDVLVDLWTRQSGRSDLVLTMRVSDINGEYHFEIDSVHVP